MRKLLFWLVLLGLVAGGVAYGLHLHRQALAEEETYTLAPVKLGTLTEVVSATGVVEPREVFPVGSELSGKVVAVLADFNQIVQEGDVLLRLDDRLARDQLHEARLAVDQAKSQRDAAAKALEMQQRLSPQVRRQIEVDLARIKLDAAEVAIKMAQARVAEAELGLQRTVLHAPVLADLPSGSSSTGAGPRRPGTGQLAPEGTNPHGKHSFIVLDRKVVLNQLIGPPVSAHLFTLASSLERLRVQVLVVEGDVRRIRPGLEARFTVTGVEDDHTFHGTVEEVRLTPANERGAVFYKVIVDARNEKDSATGGWLLRPGQTASVDIIRRTHAHAWKLPTAALNFEPAPDLLTDAARKELARLQKLPHSKQWQTVWIVGPDHKPWPLFVRTGGHGSNGETGIQEGSFTEVLEWDPEYRPQPVPGDGATYPEVIIGVPPRKKAGFFNMPNIKL